MIFKWKSTNGAAGRPRSTSVKFSLIKIGRRKTCPICDLSSRYFFLKVLDTNTEMKLYKCGCGSLFFPDAQAPDYSVVEGADSFYTRLDQAESIDSVLRPLLISEDLNDFPVIDIGCGLGFASDFVRFSNRDSLALDPSASSRLSSKLLGIPIQETLSNSDTAKIRAKRIIYCSEVIEHVEKPVDFMQSLKNYAGDLGYLIITTPNSKFVRKEVPSDAVLSILAPSQHLFIFSKEALEKLAKDSGFVWVHAWTQNERLYLIAGPRKVDLNHADIKSDYVEYLEARLKNPEVLPILRYRSYGYRLFKELVNNGQYARALSLWTLLVHFYKQLDIDLNDPDNVVLKYKKASCNRAFPEPEFYPYNLPMLMYLKGILDLAHLHDRVSAAPFLHAAINLSKLYEQVTPEELFQGYDLEISLVKNWALKTLKDHVISNN